MDVGVQCTGELLSDEIFQCGYTTIEYYIDGMKDDLQEVVDKEGMLNSCDKSQYGHLGFTVPISSVDNQIFRQIIISAKKNHVDYIVLETAGCKEDIFKKIVTYNREVIKNSDILLLLENGMIGNEKDGYFCGPYSDAHQLVEVVEDCNEIIGSKNIGVAINVGYANLLAKNLRSFLYEVRDYLKLVHINDNDGVHNDMQLPYTFTKGRGVITTDWMFFSEELRRMSFDGYLVFDTKGLFLRSPKELHITFLRMLYTIANEWNKDFDFERDILNLPNKKIILFGAGKMANTFMEKFGERYTPLFIVDNDPKKWGKRFMGVEIKKPEEILLIPEEERNVVVCNSFYEAVAMQLGKMGVQYTRCDDRYLM